MKKLSFFLMAMLISMMSFAQTTVTKTTSDLVTEYGWQVSSGSTIKTLATEFALDEVVTISTTGKPNCGSIWGTSPNNDWRIYQAQTGNVIVSVKSGYELKTIQFTYKSNNGGVLRDGTRDVSTDTAWDVTGNTTKTFTVGNTGDKTNGQARITKFSVTYVATASADAKKYTVTATVNDEKMGKVTGTGEYVENSTATIKAVANPGYEFVKWEDSSTANPRTITVTANTEVAATFQAMTPITCAEVNNLADGDALLLGEFTVVYVNDRYTYIQDATGSALLFASGLGLEAGNVVTGLAGTLSIYNGLPEIIPANKKADWTITNGTVPEPTVFAAAPAKTDVNKYVKFEGVTLSANATFTTESATNATMVVNGTNVTLRNTFKLAATLSKDKTYDIVGFVAIYNSNIQVYFLSAEELVVNHTITVSANPAEAGTVTGGGEFEETDEITVKAVANEGYEFVNWTENEEEVSTDAEYTFAVLADRALVANFKKAAPATETVYFINTKKWAAVTAHVWGGKAAESAWPGKATVKETEKVAGYDVYSFTANVGDYANIIFNNNNGGSQTADLVWTAGKYYVIDMGWLTKEEAETKLAAPLPETWNIVGDAGLMGKGWDLNAAENAMTQQADGTYLLEKKDITITAGTYEYKAAKDHGWTVAVPQDGNQKLTISKSGIYDITFVLNVTAKTLKATATLKKEAVVIPDVIIAGDMNSWNQTKDKFTMSADSLTATFKATLAVKNYGFKMIVGGAWLSDGKTITRAANSTKFTGANSSNNSTLKADIAGEYLFTWEYATKTLTVTYPALPVKYNVTVTAEHGTVTGAGTYEEGKTATLTATPAEGYQFVNWTKGEEVVSTENPYSFVVTADVALVANFELIPPTKYTVTLSDNTGGFEPLTSGAGEYEEGDEVTVSAVDSEGWVFVGWMDENGDIVSNDYQYTFVIEGNVALVAIYAQLMALEVNDLEIITEPVVGLTGTAELMPGTTLSFELIVDDSEQGEDGEFYLTEDSKVYLNDETELEFLEGIALIDMMSNTAQAQVLAAMGETLYLFNLDMSAAAELVELVLTDAIVAINEELGTLTFNVPTGEGEGYFVELSGYTAPGVHEGPQICLFETPEVAAYANYVETSVVDGVITLTGEFTSYMGGAKFDVTISGKLPGSGTALENIAVEGKAVKAIVNGQLIIIKNGVQYNAQGQVVK